MASDNLMDVVEELKDLVAELRRLLYGDMATRSSGLVADFDKHDRRIATLETEVTRLRNRRPVVGMWIGGFIAFVVAIVLIGIAFVNYASDANLLDMTPPLAGGLAAFLCAVSLVMFLGGFGWLDRR